MLTSSRTTRTLVQQRAAYDVTVIVLLCMRISLKHAKRSHWNQI